MYYSSDFTLFTKAWFRKPPFEDPKDYAERSPVTFANDIQRAGASQCAPYLGDAVITSETGHHVFDVHFNGSTFVVTDIGTFPSQPEDGIFVTADIVQLAVPEPETYALMLGGFALMGWAARRRRRTSLG